VFANLVDGGATADRHIKVDDVEKWQTNFARAVIDAGASMYIGQGLSFALPAFAIVNVVFISVWLLVCGGIVKEHKRLSKEA
jgi:hypothetical protein